MLASVCLLVSGGTSVHGQQTLEQQRSEFARGNRETKFLKAYTEALKAAGQTDALDTVVDCYLMSLPFEQRYTAEHVNDFVAHVRRADALSLLDIVEHWDRLALTDDQKSAIVAKIDQTCPGAVFAWVTGKENNPELEMPDFTLLHQALSRSALPLSVSKRALIAMWQSYCNRDVAGVIRELKTMFSKPVRFDGMFDWLMFGYVGNYLLEESDLPQCKEVIAVLEKAMDVPDKSMDLLTVEKLKDDFIGKSMMLEMGEE